ncbi:hypothetical protein D3C79_873150 [compost metagenome]
MQALQRHGARQQWPLTRLAVRGRFALPIDDGAVAHPLSLGQAPGRIPPAGLVHGHSPGHGPAQQGAVTRLPPHPNTLSLLPGWQEKLMVRRPVQQLGEGDETCHIEARLGR